MVDNRDVHTGWENIWCTVTSDTRERLVSWVTGRREVEDGIDACLKGDSPGGRSSSDPAQADSAVAKARILFHGCDTFLRIHVSAFGVSGPEC